MSWNWTPYTIALLLGSAVSATWAVHVWRRRLLSSSRTGAVLLLVAAEWMLASALKLASTDWAVKVLWHNLTFVAICAIPVTWLLFVLRHTGHEQLATPRLTALLSIVPAITFLLVFTNEAHHLIFSDLRADPGSTMGAVIVAYGPALWAYMAYGYAAVISGIFLLVQALVRSRRLYLWQGIALLCAVGAAWTASLVSHAAGLEMARSLDPTPLVLGITAPFIAWSLYRLQRLDIVPVARDKVLEGMSDAVLLLDPEDRIVDLNPAACSLVAKPLAEVVGQSVAEAWPPWPVMTGTGDARADASQELQVGNGSDTRTYDLRISPLTDWRGRLLGRVVVMRDVTDRRRAEEQVKASLREKEVLLKEIHHRVKNNLQVVSSLLSLQAEQLRHQAGLETLEDSRDRIRAMSLIHEKLYQSDDLASIDLKEYMENLATYLFRSYQVGAGNVEVLVMACEGIRVGVDQAIPCGLIANELLSNALKHAFPDGQSGTIRLELARDPGGHLVLTVADNGVGLPPDLDIRQTGSLGLRLVDSLVEELGGTIEVDRNDGTTWRITCAAPLAS